MQPVKTAISQFRRLILVILLIELISGCTTRTFTDTPEAVHSITPIVPTASPSSTPTPFTEKILFADSDQSPPAISQPLSLSLGELSQSEGWEFIVSKERPLPDLDPGTLMVIALPPDPGLAAMAHKYPEIQFLAIGIPDLQALSNLNIIGSDGFPEDQIAFIAGYISSVITKDWRSGLISQAPSAWSEAIDRSFVNGMTYYCGLCQLTYPPFYDYPIMITLPELATNREWEDAIDLMQSQAVETIFIYSYENNETALQYFSLKDLAVFGMNAPLSDPDHSWIATLRFAPEKIIQEHWNEIVQGDSGWTEEIPIVLEDVNESILSIGKQNWIQEVINDVLHGFVGTGSSIDFNSP
jgi:hypothetical protein